MAFGFGLGITANPPLNLTQQALGILASFGTNAHAYIPGIGTVSGLTAGNYLLSDGSTGLTPVDGLQGLVLDGLGSVGAESAVTGFVAGSANLTVTGSNPWLLTCTTAASIRAIKGSVLAIGTMNKVTVSWAGNTNGRALALDVGNTYSISCGAAVSGTATGYGFCSADRSVGFGPSNAQIGDTVSLTSMVFSEVSGIHATSSGASRPTERRGAYNLLLQSQTFDNASWAPLNLLPFGSGSVANAIAAPDGTMTADLIVESTATGTHSIRQNAVVSATTNTASVYLKSAGRTKLFVKYISQSANYELVFATLDLAAKTVTPLFGNGGSGAAATLTELSDGWFRLRLTGLLAAKTDGQVQILMTATGAESYTGDGTSGIYIWGAQLELGSTASDYTPTTTAAASNPLAGRYSSQYSGAQSLTLGSVPFQMSDDHCVIAGARVDSATGDQQVFSIRSTGNAIVGQLGFTVGVPDAVWRDDAGTLCRPLGGVSRVGQTIVLSNRKVGADKILRVNGSQPGATNSTAVGTTTPTHAGIGFNPANSANYLTGSTGCILAIKGTVSAADLLTLERFVASLTPNGPSF